MKLWWIVNFFKMMFSLDFHEMSLTHEWYIWLYKQVQYQALFDINKGHGVRHPPYLLGTKGIHLLTRSWCHTKKMDTTQLRSCSTIKKTQMGPLCIKNVFGILKITFKELFCKSKLNKYWYLTSLHVASCI